MKRVVVTGSDGNLGKAVVERLSQEFEVIEVDKDVVDLRNFDATKKWAKSVGNIDALVALAGGFGMRALEEMTEDDFAAMFPLNAKTAFSTLSAFATFLNPGSAVVLVGSQAYTGAANMSAYAAAKAAVISLANSAADEWKKNKVRVNCILPDIIDTPQNRQSMPDANFDAWQKPSEIAEVIAFLLSPNAINVNKNALKLGRV